MNTPVSTYLVLLSIFLSSCKYDVAPADSVYEYHAHIFMPDASQKHIGDTLHLDIEFESHTGEIVHNVNVRIYNGATLTEVYNQPSDPHVNASVSYEHQDDIVLSPANGFSEGDWVIQAKVWGETDREAEEVSTVNFHIAN